MIFRTYKHFLFKQKSVQLAIEITTNSQEQAARQEAARIEQEANGRLDRQKINDQAQSEEVLLFFFFKMCLIA